MHYVQSSSSSVIYFFFPAFDNELVPLAAVVDRLTLGVELALKLPSSLREYVSHLCCLGSLMILITTCTYLMNLSSSNEAVLSGGGTFFVLRCEGCLFPWLYFVLDRRIALLIDVLENTLVRVGLLLK